MNRIFRGNPRELHHFELGMTMMYPKPNDKPCRGDVSGLRCQPADITIPPTPRSWHQQEDCTFCIVIFLLEVFSRCKISCLLVRFLTKHIQTEHDHDETDGLNK